MTGILFTGVGVISSIATGFESFSNALRRGDDGIHPVATFDASRFQRGVAGEVPTGSRPEFADSYERCFVLARSAIREALERARLTPSPDVALVVGTTAGEGIASELSRRLPTEDPVNRRIRARIDVSPNCDVTARLAADLGICGPVVSIGTACAAGAHALCRAGDLLRHGHASICIAGGVESMTQAVFGGFQCIRALTKTACRPFDANRDGIEIGEGAAFFILETETSAMSRGVSPIGELLGYGLSNDAYHPTAPDPRGRGPTLSMLSAIVDSGQRAEDIQYINAHGTGTPLNDQAELTAMLRVFGDGLSSIPVSSTKSMIGHTIGAAGALEAATCLAALDGEFLPPTLHLEAPIGEGAVDFVPNISRQWAGRVALSNSFAFGGFCASVVVGKPSSLKD